jgi:hypothetical protein
MQVPAKYREQSLHNTVNGFFFKKISPLDFIHLFCLGFRTKHIWKKLVGAMTKQQNH